MSAPVDVLAVMKHHEKLFRAKVGTPLNELQEARAAVAELMEMAAHMIHEREAMGQLNPDWVVFRATLVRCKGEGA